MDPSNMFGMFNMVPDQEQRETDMQKQQQQWMMGGMSCQFPEMGMMSNMMPAMSNMMPAMPNVMPAMPNMMPAMPNMMPAMANMMAMMQPDSAMKMGTTNAAPSAPPRKAKIAPSAAGSEAHLLEQPKPIQVKRSVLDEEAKDNNEDIEEDDSVKAPAKFKAFMDKLKSKQKKKAAPSTKEWELNSEEELSDDDFIKKTKKKTTFVRSLEKSTGGASKEGKKSVGRPKGKEPYKTELQDLAKSQLKKIKLLEKEEKMLKDENCNLLMEIKMNKQQSADASLVIEISDDDDEQRQPTGLPMSFAWDEKDIVCKKPDREKPSIDKDCLKKEEKAEYDWTAEEAEGTFDIPHDDYGALYDEDTLDSVPDIPYLHKDSERAQDNIQNACKACHVQEVVYQILPCKHIGLCSECESKFNNLHRRCPGCGNFHVLCLEKVYF